MAPTANVFAVNQVEYEVQMFDSGLASWTIRQTLTVNDTYDDLNQFQGKVQLLAEAAFVATNRNMSAEAVSLSSTISGSYISVEYIFLWHNFSKTENGSILLGDVFETRSVFPRLYGDGTVKIVYPSGYEVYQVLPSPSLRDDSIRLLEWLGTAEFDNGNVDIKFKMASEPNSVFDPLYWNIIMIGGAVALVAASLGGILAFRRRKSRRTISAEMPSAPTPTGLESDEEKIVKMLRSVGGSMLQSVLTDHFKFSRSKTSQILSAMESRGVIKRERRGRDKIVTLVNKDEEGRV